MTETFVPDINHPGALVPVDRDLEAMLAINLLDEEPAPARWRLEPPRFPHADVTTEERIPVLAG